MKFKVKHLSFSPQQTGRYNSQARVLECSWTTHRQSSLIGCMLMFTWTEHVHGQEDAVMCGLIIRVNSHQAACFKLYVRTIPVVSSVYIAVYGTIHPKR